MKKRSRILQQQNTLLLLCMSSSSYPPLRIPSSSFSGSSGTFLCQRRVSQLLCSFPEFRLSLLSILDPLQELPGFPSVERELVLEHRSESLQTRDVLPEFRPLLLQVSEELSLPGADFLEEVAELRETGWSGEGTSHLPQSLGIHGWELG